MSSRIEQIIEEIEEYVDSCKFQPLSTTKIVVNKEELEELLRELRMKTPEEIKRYQKIISNKDAILADAQEKADIIIAEANLNMETMINESEVMRKAIAQSQEVLADATRRAQDIVGNATADANNIRYGAIKYTDDMLANLEEIMGHTIETAGVKYNNFINSIQSCYEIVNKNRTELSFGTNNSGAAAAAPADDYASYSEEELN
jgi:hypothetical protein